LVIKCQFTPTLQKNNFLSFILFYFFIIKLLYIANLSNTLLCTLKPYVCIMLLWNFILFYLSIIQKSYVRLDKVGNKQYKNKNKYWKQKCNMDLVIHLLSFMFSLFILVFYIFFFSRMKHLQILQYFFYFLCVV